MLATVLSYPAQRSGLQSDKASRLYLVAWWAEAQGKPKAGLEKTEDEGMSVSALENKLGHRP